jgi:hypothetical protein
MPRSPWDRTSGISSSRPNSYYRSYTEPFSWQLPETFFTRLKRTHTVPSSNSYKYVSFSSTPIYSCLPRDDELYVMKSFTRHMSRCVTCTNLAELQQSGGRLCATGYGRALDVAQYFYIKDGKACSKIDRSQTVRVEIPTECRLVHLLLQTMEQWKPRPITTYRQNASGVQYSSSTRHGSHRTSSSRFEYGSPKTTFYYRRSPPYFIERYY